MIQPDEAAALLTALLLHTQRLVKAHTQLVERAAERGALTLSELTEHEELLAEVRGVVEAQRRFLGGATD